MAARDSTKSEAPLGQEATNSWRARRAVNAGSLRAAGGQEGGQGAAAGEGQQGRRALLSPPALRSVAHSIDTTQSAPLCPSKVASPVSGHAPSIGCAYRHSLSGSTSLLLSLLLLAPTGGRGAWSAWHACCAELAASSGSRGTNMCRESAAGGQEWRATNVGTTGAPGAQSVRQLRP